MSQTHRGRFWLLGTLLSFAVIVGATACSEAEPAAFAGFRRTPTPVVDGQTLPAVEEDGAETEFVFRADSDGLLLVYFGYTSCPDYCPTTLSDLRKALDQTAQGGDNVNVAMVTIDPVVDTPGILTGYVRSFVPDAAAVRTLDDARLRSVADVFGADYGTVPDDEGVEQVYHTGSLYAVDETGRLLLTWPFGVSIEDLTRDIDRLLREAEELT